MKQLLPFALLLLPLFGSAADKEPERPVARWPQWRGSDRLNLSSDKGLLTRWPDDGPPSAWQVNGIGQGVGTVAIVGGKIYLLGHRDKDEYLTAIDEATGKPLWSVPLGPSQKEYDPMRWLSQRTALVDDGRVYSVTAKGESTCVDADTGKVLWRKDFVKDFQGRRGGFGVCDQLLIDGNQLIIVPGGMTSVAALDKKTGETIWKCPIADSAAYVGAVVVEAKEVRKHYVAVLHQGLVGVSTDGKVLWRNTQFKGNTADSCTPNILANKLFGAENYSRGVILLELTNNAEGVEAQQIDAQAMATPSWHEMVACVGDHIYLGSNQDVFCLELKTGKILWKDLGTDKKLRLPYSGTWADAWLYLRTQQGMVYLVKVSPEGHSIDGEFKVPDYNKPKSGSTSPVVAGGRLYVRDDERLFCYDVLQGSKPGKPSLFEAPPVVKGEEPPKKSGEPDAIYAPTPQDVVEKMLELVKIDKIETLVDLGCGDGRIVVHDLTPDERAKW